MARSGLTRVEIRVVRIIKCLRLLEVDCYSACDLAGHFRVSKRTVYRDLRVLAHAGVPLVRRTDDRRFHVPGDGPASRESVPWRSADCIGS